MKHILKFILGFSIAMVVLLLFVVVVSFGWYVFYSVLIILAVYMCYILGSFIWNIVELIYDEKELE